MTYLCTDCQANNGTYVLHRILHVRKIDYLITGEVQGPFEDAVNLLENSNLKGKTLVSVVDELENVVLH